MRIIIQEGNKNLVGGFNPFEKYESKWEASPNRGEHKKYLKPPTRITYITQTNPFFSVFRWEMFAQDPQVWSD